MEKTAVRGAIPASLIATAVLISSVAPLATDMYVPAFPHVARDLAASTTAVQLTLTTFFVGMALGQLLGGPISDQRGRRMPLVLGTVGVTLASVVCALAPSIEVLAVARLAQGFAGGWAMVVVRAVLVDLARGSRLVRVLNLMSGVGGIALILGPLLGGVIVQFSVWQTSFWLVAAAGVAMTACVLRFVPDTLPRGQRHGGGLRTFVTASTAVLKDRRYVGYVVVASAMMIVVFAYVSSSAFILEDVNGLGPIQYSIDFAGNAAAASIAALLAARLARRVPTRRVIGAGQGLGIAGAVVLLAAGSLLDAALVPVIVGFLALMLSHGLSTANAGALASAQVPEHPGTGSAVLGMFQWLAAGIGAPIAGLLGSDLTVAAAQLALAGLLVSLIGFLVLARRNPPARAVVTP
ncbi:multidrug effflux MFS transporter [Amnibacterium sp.]|uniref:multidrug effflux MFS transporter n=1 Tax=Amnibacterium sp. TaxID=1872496 RepID=UPI0026357AC5|nr:multidrug effflux MFS transporter [Amnibacterium sp.]MCU1473014.1 putative MFS-type transporter YdgK [Amnibacterium sp.]